MYSISLRTKLNGEEFLDNQTLLNGKSINKDCKINLNIYRIILNSKILKIDFQAIQLNVIKEEKIQVV